MTLSDLASLGSFVSGVAVLLSLIFLYFQLRQVNVQVRQAERNQQASIRQARTTRAVDLGIATLEPSMNAAFRSAMSGADDISAAQIGQFMSMSRAYFLHFEDSYGQHEDGLLSDAAFETFEASLKVFFRSPAPRYAWRLFRESFAGQFRDYLDGLLERTPVAPPIDMVADFKAGIAAEKATASPSL